MSAWNGYYPNGTEVIDPASGRVMMNPCPECGDLPDVDWDCPVCDGDGEIPIRPDELRS